MNCAKNVTNGKFLQVAESLVVALFLVSEVLFNDKWKPFLLVSKHYFLP